MKTATCRQAGTVDWNDRHHEDEDEAGKPNFPVEIQVLLGNEYLGILLKDCITRTTGYRQSRIFGDKWSCRPLVQCKQYEQTPATANNNSSSIRSVDKDEE